MKKTTPIYAWLQTAPDGSEGIMTLHRPGSDIVLPLIAQTRGNALALHATAVLLARRQAVKIRLLRFSGAEELAAYDFSQEKNHAAPADGSR